VSLFCDSDIVCGSVPVLIRARKRNDTLLCGLARARCGRQQVELAEPGSGGTLCALQRPRAQLAREQDHVVRVTTAVLRARDDGIAERPRGRVHARQPLGPRTRPVLTRRGLAGFQMSTEGPRFWCGSWPDSRRRLRRVCWCCLWSRSRAGAKPSSTLPSGHGSPPLPDLVHHAGGHQPDSGGSPHPGRCKVGSGPPSPHTAHAALTT
jgi:hypothetical protein